MDLPLDVLRSIALLLRIEAIKNLSSINKSFYSLCCERNLWFEKFKENNLIIINNKIITLRQYMDEYRKVSYATYITNCLINMIEIRGFSIDHHVLWFSPFFSFNDLVNILSKNHLIFDKIKDDDIRKYIAIDIIVGDKGIIGYDSYEQNNDDNEDNERIEVLNEKYNDKNIIISLITKILYYHPSININDINYLPIVISKNIDLEKVETVFEQNIINKRKEYWDECYSKYENLYF